jgi:RNA polymerase sigma-70 factor (ECF subfamily)
MIALAMPQPATRDAPHAGETSSELDAGTLARCMLRDPLAFRAFVATYQGPVFALLGRLLGRRDVDDLAQETFLRAYNALPTFDPTRAGRPSAWILTIAARLALNERSRARRLEPLEAVPEPALASTPESESSRAQLGRAIARAVATLPDDQRAAFVLAEYHDLGMEDIARALEVPEGTAKTRLFRARAKLRESLAEWIDTSGGARGRAPGGESSG